MRVKTINGKLIKKINSIMYKDEFYSKKDDCYKIGGRYYPFNHPDVAFDEETKEYNLKSRMYNGFISFEGKNPILGFFSENDLNNVVCHVQRGIRTIAINQDILPDNYIEAPSTGEFYNNESYSSRDIEVATTIKTITSHKEKGYNIEDNTKEYESKKEFFKAWTPIIPKKLKKLAKLLGPYTFGIENEVILGTIPERICKPRGVVLCRDGSVQSGEYVSVPMSGAKGIFNIASIAKEMSNRTVTDNSCSYHIHIGNFQTSRIFLLTIYKLIENIQDELFTMLPYYKTNWRGIKQKNYNQKLEPLFPVYVPNERVKTFKDYINYNYAKLFRFLSSVNTLPCKKTNRKQLKHPITGGKWGITSRYYCVNLLNAVFSPRNTVEFRCFQNTTNPHKMVSWLFICTAIIKYAEKNANKILTSEKHITLEEVMNIYKDNNPKSADAIWLSGYLNAYIENRKEYFLELVEEGDFKGERETLEDKAFTFEYLGKTLI